MSSTVSHMSLRCWVVFLSIHIRYWHQPLPVIIFPPLTCLVSVWHRWYLMCSKALTGPSTWPRKEDGWADSWKCSDKAPSSESTRKRFVLTLWARLRVGGHLAQGYVFFFVSLCEPRGRSITLASKSGVCLFDTAFEPHPQHQHRLFPHGSSSLRRLMKIKDPVASSSLFSFCLRCFQTQRQIKQLAHAFR